MNEELFKILQQWLFEYCVDQSYINSPRRITLVGLEKQYDVENKGDIIVLQPLILQDKLLQSKATYNYNGGSRGSAYENKQVMNLWIRYFGKNSLEKANKIYVKARQTDGNARRFLKSKNVSLFLDKIKEIPNHINSQYFGLSIIECKLYFFTSSFANQNNISIKDVQFEINSYDTGE